jgi:hypothetical protein
MEGAATDELRAELVAALAGAAERLRSALREALARPIALEPGRRLQFEADPFGFGVTLCATEETILPGGWLDEALPADWFERAEQAGSDWDATIREELCPWFAAGWQAAGGPAVYRPAYLFFHGYHREQYDLERRRWLPSAEAFGA